MARIRLATRSVKRVRVSSPSSVLDYDQRNPKEPETVEITCAPETKKPKTMVTTTSPHSRIVKKLKKHLSDVKLKGEAEGSCPMRSLRMSSPEDPETLVKVEHPTVRDQEFAEDEGAAATTSPPGGHCASGGSKPLREMCAEGRRRKLERQREEARRKIESMTNTARFSDNLDSMNEFTDLMGLSPMWPITTC